MIEKDIKGISKEHKKLNKTLKAISDWQVKHEKEDSARQEEVMGIIKTLATKEDVSESVGEAVDTKINGKLIGLKEGNNEIKDHLKKQDVLQLEMQVNLQTLTAKIDPVDGARRWASLFVRGTIYLGGFCFAIVGIIKFLQTFNIIK